MLRKCINKIIAVVTVVSVFGCGVFSASAAFDIDDLQKDDRLDLGYRIINGYSKLSEQNGLTNYNKTAVYSGLNLKNAYLMALAGGFYLANKVDFGRTINDNDYALSLIRKLDGFLKGMWVKNDRAQKLEQELQSRNIPVIEAYDTVGLFLISTGKKQAEQLMNDKLTDFVFAGGKVPPTMKDLNLDGKCNAGDIPLMQKYLNKELKYSDRDKQSYLEFAADFDGDKSPDIKDVTALQKELR